MHVLICVTCSVVNMSYISDSDPFLFQVLTTVNVPFFRDSPDRKVVKYKNAQFEGKSIRHAHVSIV